MSADAGTDIISKPKDDEFYISSLICITFEVGGILFRVPRLAVETESKVFRHMFTLPVPINEPAEGSSDEKPLILLGITAKAFHAFFKVAFDDAHAAQVVLTQEEWISVLRLAHMWDCPRIFRIAVGKLHVALVDNPARKIMLAKTYNIANWLRPAYFRLVTRRKELDWLEMIELGGECAIKLNTIRDQIRKWAIVDRNMVWPRTPSPERYPRHVTGISGAPTRTPHVIHGRRKHECPLDDAINVALTQAFHLE